MIPYKTFAVIGGDLRQAHIANRLASQGKTVYALLLEENASLNPSLQCASLDCLGSCDCVILPMPLSSDDKTIHAPFSRQTVEAAEVFSRLRPGVAVFAGRISAAIRESAGKYGIMPMDYLEREELAVRNAAITAEGAIALAINEMPISLIGANVLVTGYGRISRALLHRLPAMGARIYAVARKCKDRAEISDNGCTAVPMSQLGEASKNADVIFNTVPAPLFTREILAGIKQDALLIDLASKPGGVGAANA